MAKKLKPQVFIPTTSGEMIEHVPVSVFAEIMGVTKETVYQWIGRGMSHVVLYDKTWIPVDIGRAWVQEHLNRY